MSNFQTLIVRMANDLAYTLQQPENEDLLVAFKMFSGSSWYDFGYPIDYDTSFEEWAEFQTHWNKRRWVSQLEKDLSMETLFSLNKANMYIRQSVSPLNQQQAKRWNKIEMEVDKYGASGGAWTCVMNMARRFLRSE